MLRVLGCALLVLAVTVGCTGPGGEPSPTESTDAAADAEFELELRRTLTLPPIPAFSIPTELLANPESQRLSGELDVPPGLYQGIAVLDARCTDTGEATAADAGDAVLGSAQHFEDDTVSMTIAGDGTGVYDSADVHIAVLAGGAGVFDDGETRVSVAADGSGTYRSGDERYTVRADGSGSYSNDEIRVWIDPDGAGGYEDDTMRLSLTSDGELFGDGEDGRVAAVKAVLADGLPPFPPVPAVEVVKPSGTVCGTVIRLDANVLFDFGSADVQPAGREYLQRVAGLLTALGSPRAQINGHTDGVGEADANLDLSERRANTVRDLLVGFGLDSGSLEPRGIGEGQPLRPETLADGSDDAAARQLNRRVEILLLD